MRLGRAIGGRKWLVSRINEVGGRGGRGGLGGAGGRLVRRAAVR